MIGRELVGTKPATVAELENILEKRAKDGELGFEQQTTLDYAKKNKKLKKEEAVKLVKELLKMEKMKEDVAAKIADVMPRNEVEVNLLFSKERTTLDASEAKQVLEIVGKYR
ncbi:DNA-directed RNA polymerase subunit F [Candidatus Micrarchaeota archaeon]|nr:DNA-directed RNA polymerase subunit F [Candidatus Micrarchaeota archaeon]